MIYIFGSGHYGNIYRHTIRRAAAHNPSTFLTNAFEHGRHLNDPLKISAVNNAYMLLYKMPDPIKYTHTHTYSRLNVVARSKYAYMKYTLSTAKAKKAARSRTLTLGIPAWNEWPKHRARKMQTIVTEWEVFLLQKQIQIGDNKSHMQRTDTYNTHLTHTHAYTYARAHAFLYERFRTVARTRRFSRQFSKKK